MPDTQKKPQKIICPYCFNEFTDEDVHFRMETVFTEDNLDPTGEHRSREEIEMDGRFSNEERKKQISEYNLREHFLKRKDEKYEKFWADYAGTTEKPIVSSDGKEPTLMPYERPVFDPKNEEHKKFFGTAKKESDVIADGRIVYAAIDCFGERTKRRVCPFCHNPLPGLYGKFPVKFISVIGISGAGKTVYLSQLCKHLSNQITYYGITANPTSDYSDFYLKANPVVMGKRLPIGTPPEQLLQPLMFDLIFIENGLEHCYTTVFYDIAGENCVNTEAISKFGKFVEHSDAIMLLIDPDQFKTGTDTAQPVRVLQTIYNLFQNKKREEVRELPLAVCISKGDKIANVMINQPTLEDVAFLRDAAGNYLPRFNAKDYNPIHDGIKNFVQMNNNQLHVQLQNIYDNYNYFLFSAIGTSVKKIEGTDLDTPAGPVIPKRIIEPVVWLLMKLRFIANEPETHEPKDWICSTCSRRMHVTEKFCPSCKTNNKGEWLCPRCRNVNTGEWCSTRGCRTNKDGKRRFLF